jgi:hypothetical protein
MAAPEGYNALGKIGISYKGDYDSNTTYERLDAVEHNGSTYLAIKDAPDGAPRDDKVNWIYLAKGFSGDIGDSEITFTEAENRENINTGESVKTVFGKIKKFFADLTAPAFAQMITTKEDLLATKATGYVPDAKAVADAYTELNGKLNQDADLTLVNCVSWSSDNSISKIGNRVFVTIGVQITSEQSSGSLIITNIAKTYYPKNAYVRANATGGTSGNNHNIYINKSSGTIILNPSTERYYSASFSYLSD